MLNDDGDIMKCKKWLVATRIFKTICLFLKIYFPINKTIIFSQINKVLFNCHFKIQISYISLVIEAYGIRILRNGSIKVKITW